MADLPATYRRRLHDLAVNQYGYITSRDAAALRIPLIAMHQIAARGGLRHIAFGVYRFDDIPVTSRDSYMEAVLTVGDGAFLVADAVLALHNLGLVNPTRLRVGTSRRVRATTIPPTIQIVSVKVADGDLTMYEAIPCTTVARALVDSVGIVMSERLIDAASEAADRGLLRRRRGGWPSRSRDRCA
jgi:predicted transcriptional regulator of viral defense system